MFCNLPVITSKGGHGIALWEQDTQEQLGPKEPGANQRHEHVHVFPPNQKRLLLQSLKVILGTDGQKQSQVFPPVFQGFTIPQDNLHVNNAEVTQKHPAQCLLP